MITSNNLVVVTTTLSNNNVSEKRRTNMINSFSKYKVSVVYNHGVKKSKFVDNLDISFRVLLDSMYFFNKNLNTEYCILCDDDFVPVDDFLNQLNKTVAVLPNDWRTLHLCPGKGRRRRDVFDGETDPTNRVFINCKSDYYLNRTAWLGGPIAILIRKRDVDNYSYEYFKQFLIRREPADVLLTLILKEKDFICNVPMLGFEKEEGGSTYKF